MQRHGIAVPDRQLACVPLRSADGEAYLGAMAAAANFAWANRQVMAGLVERAFAEVLGTGPAALGFRLVYDVCHNVAKLEEHVVDGRPRRVYVHRKGATRAFRPGHPALGPALRRLGQPVIIPGDMGRYSFLLLGAQGAMTETFGTACHGAGRVMSRHQALRTVSGPELRQRLEAAGIAVRGASARGLAEETPEAYKDVNAVVEAAEGGGLCRKIARLVPLGVVKG